MANVADDWWGYLSYVDSSGRKTCKDSIRYDLDVCYEDQGSPNDCISVIEFEDNIQYYASIGIVLYKVFVQMEMYDC